MASKLGAPQPGTARRLTNAEAAALGCSAKWWVRVGHDGAITLLSPSKQNLWAVGAWMTTTQQRRVRDILTGFWERSRGVWVDPGTLARIVSAAASAVPYATDRHVRSELEWVSRLAD